MTALLIVGGCLAAVLVTGLVLRLFNPLPPPVERGPEGATVDGGDTRIGRAVAAGVQAHPGLSGVRTLDDAQDAFAVRMLLIESADRRIDAQYYIWHGDTSGTMLLHALLRAAERGVMVRLLVDDNGTSGLDPVLKGFDQHPNIAVQIFNPFMVRKPKPIGYVMDFLRLNRRMHNKSLTVDDQATVIGGRNVGDEYFGARQSGLFADLDIVAVGPVVADVAADFERYWRSAAAYPAAMILRRVKAESTEDFAARATRMRNEPQASAYIDSFRDNEHIQDLMANDYHPEWAPVRMVSDSPDKVLRSIRRRETLSGKLDEILEKPERCVGLVSGYFVPAKAGTKAFTARSRAGTDIRVLTNSFRATDVVIVHAGYIRRRRALVAAGVTIFELYGGQPLGAARQSRRSWSILGSRSRPAPVRRRFGSGVRMRGGSRPALRSSASMLHAKTFTVDRRRLFVGSFNFDQRSMHLNTELGFVIESPSLACRLQDMLENDVMLSAYEVKLDAGGRMQWIEHCDDRIIVHRTEPNTTLVSRTVMRVISWLPIEWML